MKRIILFLCVLVFSLFYNVIDVRADENANKFNKNLPEDSRDNSSKTDNVDNANLSNTSNEDIFGDEQAFPFIAGLGKNAAH